MPEADPIQVGFQGGQLGPRMAGRPDLTKFQTGCQVADNFILTVQGPAIKRSGLRFVKAVRDQSKKSRMIPFEFSSSIGYALEFSQNAIRFNRAGSAILETAVAISAGTPPTIANPCVITTNVAHGYASGDEVYIAGSRLAMLNSQFLVITVLSATTFSMSAGGTAVTSVGEALIAAGTNTVARVYTITNGVASNVIPYLEADLAQVQIAQDRDVAYLTHPSYWPKKLTMTSEASWTCVDHVPRFPAFRPENVSTVTMYVSAATGAAITLTAVGGTPFTANMVGGYIKLGELIESKHPKWIANDSMAIYFGGGGISVGDDVYYGQNVYRLNAKNGAAKTGNSPPIHDSGIENDNSKAASSFDWKFINRGWGYAKVTGFTSSTVITVDVNTYGLEFPAAVVGVGGATRKWAIGAWSAEYGYPTAVEIFEQRLWYAGTSADPMGVWASRTFRFDDFETAPTYAEFGIQFALSSKTISPIQWMLGQDVMVIGTTKGEFAQEPSIEATTADNLNFKRRSGYGSAVGVVPLYVDSALLFVHRSGVRLHEMIYDVSSPNANRFVAPDLTAISDMILDSGVVSLAYQAAPWRQVWAVMADGRLASLTYVKDQEVTAWAEHPVGGYVGGEGTVESACVVTNGSVDQLWLTVKRGSGSSLRRFIEILDPHFEEGDALADGFFVDAGLTYSGVAATSLYGFLHMFPSTVLSIYSNGVSTAAQVSAKGIITAASTTKAQVGFPFTAQLSTMTFEAGSMKGSAQGKKGRISHLITRLHNSAGAIYYGPDFTSMDPWSPPAATPLYTGDTTTLEMPGGYNRDRRVCWRQTDSVPLTIVAAMPTLSVP